VRACSHGKRSRPQDFTKEITLPRERWAPFIKDYDGGTLMECIIHPRVPYAALPQMLAAQAGALEARLREASRAHLVRGPLCAEGEKFKPRPPAEIPGALAAQLARVR
jgi:histone acetyltransferase